MAWSRSFSWTTPGVATEGIGRARFAKLAINLSRVSLITTQLFLNGSLNLRPFQDRLHKRSLHVRINCVTKATKTEGMISEEQITIGLLPVSQNLGLFANSTSGLLVQFPGVVLARNQ
jgi:hypothetical protein